MVKYFFAWTTSRLLSHDHTSPPSYGLPIWYFVGWKSIALTADRCPVRIRISSGESSGVPSTSKSPRILDIWSADRESALKQTDVAFCQQLQNVLHLDNTKLPTCNCKEAQRFIPAVLGVLSALPAWGPSPRFSKKMKSLHEFSKCKHTNQLTVSFVSGRETATHFVRKRASRSHDGMSVPQFHVSLPRDDTSPEKHSNYNKGNHLVEKNHLRTCTPASASSPAKQVSRRFIA